jgi:molecular chaperone DnaJ
MTPHEAYKTLDVSADISDDDLKKKYKELCFKYHPDRYKEDPNKFKVINEAYQLICDYRQNPAKYEPQKPGFWGNVQDIAPDFFVNFGFENEWSQPRVQPTNIRLNVNISFYESVKGCNKEITYKRTLKCDGCDGIGIKKTGNGCDGCDGFGRVTTNNRGVIFQSACSKCNGKNVKQNRCEKCRGKRHLEENRTGSITVPPGTSNGDILRLMGEGNFAQRGFFGDTYTDVFVSVSVKPHATMHQKEGHVYSTLKISLLEALEGVTKEIETVYGVKQVTVKAGSRHSDQIKIPECGVKTRNGMHIVQLDVDYPEDLSKLIGALKDGVHNTV